MRNLYFASAFQQIKAFYTVCDSVSFCFLVQFVLVFILTLPQILRHFTVDFILNSVQILPKYNLKYLLVWVLFW